MLKVFRASFTGTGFAANKPAQEPAEILRRDAAQGPRIEGIRWGRKGGWELRGEFLQTATREAQRRGPQRLRVPAWQGLSPTLLGRLQQLRALPKGWDGDDTAPIRPEAIVQAERALEHLASTYLHFREPTVVPKYDSYVQLEWHNPDRTLELEATPKVWAAMGAMRQGERMVYFEGSIATEDWSALDECYRWWAERLLVWPLPLS